ncbi:MAG: FHA domain-containing protein [Planctomycetota bacterium]
MHRLGTNLIKVSLVYRNGDRRGERVEINSSPMRIGRHESCQLVLESSRISRQHAAIVLDESAVFISDLGSRNGTAVNGKLIPANQPRRLWHRDKLQVGKWKFRVSVRDAATKKAISPPKESPTDEFPLDAANPVRASETETSANLLSELDSLAANLSVAESGTATMEASGFDWEKLAQSGFVSQVADDDASSSTNSPAHGAKPEQESDPRTSANQEELVNTKSDRPSGETADPKPLAPTHPKSASTSKDADQADPDDDSVSKESDQRKLPEHLRPKGPEDSQDAANQALRRMFGNY